MLIQTALALALLAVSVCALPSSAPLLKRAERLPTGVNHSLELSVGKEPLTQCSPVNITWSEAVQPEGEAGGSGGNYTVTVEANLLEQKARVFYEQRTFTPDEPRMWEWPADVPAGSTVNIMVSSFENGNASQHDGDIWYGAIPTTNISAGSSSDSCVPAVNRPIVFDETQLDSVRSCQPVELGWSGSAPPYQVWLYTQNTVAGPGNGRDRISLGTTNETSIAWNVDFPAGLYYFLEIRAANSLRSYSMNSAKQVEGDTGDCAIPEQHQLLPISAASPSSFSRAMISSFWIIFPPSIALWLIVA